MTTHFFDEQHHPAPLLNAPAFFTTKEAGSHSSPAKVKADGFTASSALEAGIESPNELHTRDDSLTTEKFADAIDLRPQSIRKRYAQTGSYFGVVPSKLPNGRLRWPSDAVNQLLGRTGE